MFYKTRRYLHFIEGGRLRNGSLNMLVDDSNYTNSDWTELDRFWRGGRGRGCGGGGAGNHELFHLIILKEHRPQKNACIIQFTT